MKNTVKSIWDGAVIYNESKKEKAKRLNQLIIENPDYIEALIKLIENNKK